MVNYITQVVALLVGDGEVDLISAALDNARLVVEKFISDQQVSILAVDRLLEQSDDGSDETNVIYTALIEMHYRKNRLATVIFVKKNPVILAETPVKDQLLVNS